MNPSVNGTRSSLSHRAVKAVVVELGLRGQVRFEHLNFVGPQKFVNGGAALRGEDGCAAQLQKQQSELRVSSWLDNHAEYVVIQIHLLVGYKPPKY